ncbi:Tetratricopeptide repeat-containing protein [Paenibacillus sp. CF095]|uniref:SMI1/KNR4 family protein n=1 Tax=Paenibacillus TaxID=44249 RepID=UPI000890497E|nr:MULTISPECIES: SMI1/KNR4 family protein [Paenibacillus]TDL65723.1 tetratricopeptide repeat protein [Paenibacillus amylolyticus]SDD28208.1 Tetratricopeptide repeat-containing protein [Paenibacillus sp. CF095]
MRDDLLVQLQEWHEEDEFQEIVDAIQAIPVEERDYELVNHLGRALNNLEQYEEAVEQFLTVAKEGTGDPLWHYRIGLAYYYLEQYAHALQAFERADELDPGDEDTLEFLEWIRSKTAEESVEKLVNTVPSVSEISTAPVSVGHLEPMGFWNDNAEAVDQYVLAPPTDEQVESVEEQLVFKLPTSYINMMKLHNGGVPHYRYFPVSQAEAAKKVRVEVAGILGIGREKAHSLGGEAGSRFIIEQGGYPEIGVVICECPSESEVVMLDYRESGNAGEPEVVHVDKKESYKITWLAPNFETFIQGLVNEENQPANLEGSL